MSSIDLTSYKNIYIQTAKEYIDSLSESCTKLTDNLQDLDAVNSLYISSHSLRSQSEVMGFTNMTSLCAVIEKISKSILDRNFTINMQLTNILKEAVDGLNLCLSKIEKKNTEKDLGPIIKKLDAEINSA